MKPNLDNLKEYTNKTSLTKEEKFAMLQNIREYSNAHPVKNPYYSIFFKHSLAYASMITLIITTSATSFAAESSLPGDILYPVKTNINEKVVKTLAFSNAQKAKVSVDLVDKRLEELEQMIVQNKDTAENIDIIIDKLEEHKEDLKEIQKDESFANSQDSINTYVALESIIDTHIDILENITDTEDSLETPVVSAKQNNETPQSKKDDVAILSLTSTNDEVIATTTEEQNKEPDETVAQIVEFSEQIDPLIMSAKTKLQKVNDVSEEKEVKEKISKEIIEKAEKKLEVDLDIKIEQ